MAKETKKAEVKNTVVDENNVLDTIKNGNKMPDGLADEVKNEIAEEEKKKKYTKYQELHGEVHKVEESVPEVALVSVEKKWYTKVFEFVKRMLRK